MANPLSGGTSAWGARAQRGRERGWSDFAFRKRAAAAAAATAAAAAAAAAAVSAAAYASAPQHPRSTVAPRRRPTCVASPRSASVAPPAMRICDCTMSTPVTCSVMVCSTWGEGGWVHGRVGGRLGEWRGGGARALE
jgi:hypothetical protein